MQSFTNDIPVLTEPLFSFPFASNCGPWKYFSVYLITKMLLNCLKQKTSVILNEENFRCNTDHILPSLVSIFKFCCSHADVTIHKTVKLLLIDVVA